MINRTMSAAAARTTVLLAALAMTISGAHAFDDAKYPDLKGQWTRAPVPGAAGQPSYDPSKPVGRGEQAPLTPEYQAIFEANLADQEAGGFGTTQGWRCHAWGMPAMMTVYQPMEIVVLPDTTYILTNDVHLSQRRIFIDGRGWPEEIEPAYQGGMSLGTWIDEDGDGHYDVLEVETRGFKGPRVYDTSGIPLHDDNQSVIRERIYLDKADANILHDRITVMDHALTRPWTVTKSYRRSPNPRVAWPEYVCAEGQGHVQIANENYYLSGDGLLMPAKKGQAPPDLRYFKQTQK
jgi:hypothetical protein